MSQNTNKKLGIGVFVNSNLWLLAGCSLALIMANFWHDFYAFLTHEKFAVEYAGNGPLVFSSHFVVVDILMVLFFFVVGAELKIDFTDKKYGAFKKASDAIAPAVAAFGGVAVPVLVCLFFAAEYGSKAFGVPMATDIAFTLAIAKMIGLIRPELAFLKALAVIDDIVGVLCIAVFYGNGFEAFPLLTALAATAFMLFSGWKLKIPSVGFYLIGMTVLWWMFHNAGIHPTLAGVVAGFSAPHFTDGQRSIASEIEHVFNAWFQPWVLFLFAFFSCGIYIQELMQAEINMKIFWGISLGLFVGKPIGIFGALYLLQKYTQFSSGFTKGRNLTIGALAGFGFTVALFVNGLAFDSQILLDSGKLGIFAGSFASVLLAIVLAFWTRHQRVQ